MRLAIPIAAVLLALAGNSASAAASTSTTDSSSLPVSGSVTNPCNGETVTWQGTAHFVVHQTATPSGHESLADHVNFQGIEGQGSLGNSYRDVNTADFEMNGSGESSQNELTTTATFRFVSEGPAPNFDASTTYHVAFDASGRPTASVTRIDADCRG
jgi:hypothetical protein